MTEEISSKPVDVIRAFFDAGNRGDMETCFGLVADDITWHNLGSHPLSGTFSGKPDLMERLLGPLFSQLENGIHTDIERLIESGDTVVALNRGTARTRDHKPYNNTYCHVFRVRNGQIYEVSEYCDSALVCQTFGEQG